MCTTSLCYFWHSWLISQTLWGNAALAAQQPRSFLQIILAHFLSSTASSAHLMQSIRMHHALAGVTPQSLLRHWFL